MKTLGEVLTLSKRYVASKSEEVRVSEVEQLIAHVLGVNRLDLYLNFERPLEEEELSTIRSHLKRLVDGTPLQYIQGFCEFMGCRITLDTTVLIPRNETEQLVDYVSEFLEQQDLCGKVLWDLCTGSGCIGISLKKRFPELKVVLSDISKRALQMAERNAIDNQVEVEILQGDLFEPFASDRADFIISNPPYISAEEFETLPPSVKNFEPSLALLAKDEGLDFYSRFSKELRQHLAPQGRGWFECGYLQGSVVKELFAKEGFATDTFYDYTGILRAIVVSFPSPTSLCDV